MARAAMNGTERTPAGPSVRQRRVHPLTWVTAAVLLPLVCWDVRQTYHDVQVRREASVQHLKHPAFALRDRENPALSRNAALSRKGHHSRRAHAQPSPAV